MVQMSQKVKDRSMAARIKKAMVSTSAICLAVLGIVSLICVSIASKTILKNNMKETAEVAATLVEVMRGIEDEIRQITDVVQNNSATAQESSAICEELSAQAMGLNGLVEEFSI